MTMLIVVIGALFVGAFFLLKSDAPTPSPVPAAPVDADELRKRLREALADVSPDWTWEDVPGEPLTLVGMSSASGQPRRLELSELAAAWGKFVAAGREDLASRTIDAFVEAVVGGTGDEAGEAGAGGEEWALQALALSLGDGAIRHDASGLSFALVVRQPTGAEPVTDDDLTEWKLDRAAAIARATANVDDSVADGLPFEVLSGDDDTPGAIRILPDDPLAPALLLSPKFAAWLDKKLGADARCFVIDGRLIATRDGAAPAGPAATHGPLAPVRDAAQA